MFYILEHLLYQVLFNSVADLYLPEAKSHLEKLLSENSGDNYMSCLTRLAEICQTLTQSQDSDNLLPRPQEKTAFIQTYD